MIETGGFTIDPLDVTFEPLAGSTFTNLLRLLAQNRFKISLIGLPRLLYATLMSFTLSPLTVYEKIKYDKQINQMVIKKPPIFIVGHWRSGTTYIHNLFSMDKQFGYPTTFQTVAPAVFLRFEKLIKPLVDSSLPEKRPQDDVDLHVDLPQEEEYALGNISPYSFYNGWCFPKNMELYNNYVDIQNIPKEKIEEFKKIYMYYLKKLTFYWKGKQLVLKNPSNTARIKILLEMFPDAKFVHIYRNPYHVYLSMMRNIEKEMTLYCIQKPPDKKTFEKSMVNLYNRMHTKYFKEKKLIPPENLVETRYEEFLANPLKEMKRIYDQLNIPGFEKNKKRFEEYIKTQSKIKTYKYKIDKDLKQKIYNHLKQTIDLWKYDV
ncbi:MAG TPA: sulfotransferase [Thermoplasmatales archaeon]|nr:sulfotransferase [Thermoplasmatales archaeon]